MPSIEEIRAAIKKQTERSGGNRGNGGGSNVVYPFWNLDFGATSTLRFLPDGNEKNPLFWVEKFSITLPFQGIVGQSDKEVKVTVPCMQTYKKNCPITSEIAAWWKTDMEHLAQKYYRKKQYIFQGFVASSAFEEKEVPENPIRQFNITGKLFNIIQSSLMDPEMENSPTDYEGGVDFKLTKTRNGEWPDYTTSQWSRRSRDLSQEELDAIEKFGLVDLSTRLPKEPTEEELEAIVEMFHASLNDEAYDPARWSKYYRPFGLEMPKNDNIMDSDEPVKKSTPVTKVTAKPVATKAVEVEEDEHEAEEVAEAPVEPAASTGEKKSPADIIAQLRARKNA